MAQNNINIPDILVIHKNYGNGAVLNHTKNKSEKELKFKDSQLYEIDNVPVAGIKLKFNKPDYPIFIEDPRGFSMHLIRSSIPDLLRFSSYDKENGFTGEFVYGKIEDDIILVSSEDNEYTYSQLRKTYAKLPIYQMVQSHYYDINTDRNMLFLGKIPVLNVHNFGHKHNINDTYFQSKYTVNDMYVFKTEESEYRVYDGNDINRIDFICSIEKNMPITFEDLDKERAKFYLNTGLPSKFKEITKILPNRETLSQNFEDVYNDFADYTDEKFCKYQYRIWLFDDDFKSVTRYSRYRRFNNDVREIFAYKDYVYKIDSESKNTIKTKHFNKLTTYDHCEILMSELIDKYKDTGRMFICSAVISDRNTCLLIDTDSGYKFKAIETNDYYRNS